MKYCEKMRMAQNEKIMENYDDIQYFLNTIDRRLWRKRKEMEMANNKQEEEFCEKQRKAIYLVRLMLFSVSAQYEADMEEMEAGE